jgi:hypothetical protein
VADAPPLLVPIPLHALLINKPVTDNVVFARWTNVYRSLESFEDPVPPPFSNIHPPSFGVDLHWKLPSALTHGSGAKGSTNVDYPFTPNRWVVVRYASTLNATAPPRMTAWVIESDHLGDPHGTPFATRRGDGSVQLTQLGRSVAIQQWAGEAGGQVFLKATTADVTFTAYQPGNVNVYSFHDDVKKPGDSTNFLDDDTLLTYLVAGWYSDPAHDPLVKSTPDKLRWSVLGGDPSAPKTSVFHGMLAGVKWNASTLPDRDDPDARSMQLGIGYTSIDALAAVVNARAKQPSGSDLERKLEAFQYGVLQTLDDPDGEAQLELKIRQAWFGSTPGGTVWDIVAVSQGQQDQQFLDSTSIPLPPPLTTDQANWLAALNTQQRQYDQLKRQLMTMQWEVFSLWWKQQRAPWVDAQQEQLGIDVSGPNNVILGWINNALDNTQPSSVLSQVLALQQQVAAFNLPDPTSETSIKDYVKKFMPPGGTTPPTPLTLRPRAMPSFFHPADPVLLIAGITPPSADVDNSKPLPCRIATAAATGVTVSGTTVSRASGSLAGVIQIPTSPKLSSPVAAAITALAVETFFADPNNAQSIAMNGAGIAAPAGLAAAIAAGTAQVATIANPLQARFAFAQWRQAWSPLFIEWLITWEPSVTANRTGPAEPPAAAVIDGFNPAKDNWTFVAGNWQFDGSDHVMQRGSEYYQWTGGDLWTASPPVGTQQYKGRTFLTPQATYLFIRRLSEYVKLHPDDDLSDVLKLIRAVGETRFLSQSLSGFNSSFIMRALQQTLPPPKDSPIGHAIGGEYRGVPFVSIGNQDLVGSPTGGSPFFFPVRGGFFKFERLRIVDAFGQVLDLLQANGNISGQAVSFQPIRGAGMVPDANAGIGEPTRCVKQAPRIVQPNRLDLRLLDATDDTKEIFLTPGTNPVCGWFLPNHLDQSIAVYDASGDALGELLILIDPGSGNEKVTWLAAPNAANPVTDPSQIRNARLRGAITAFTSSGGGISGDRPAAFRAFYTSIDETLWMVDPIGAQGDQDLAVLIGRPLALVRSQVQFELFGRPAWNESWRDTLQFLTADFTSIPFPIRLGSTELLNDGLIGYFTGDTYTSFNAVHPSTTASSPYIAPVGGTNVLALPFNYPGYASQTLTMLLDPYGVVHATTGLLPVAQLSLPAQFFKDALARMAVTFRIGPIMTSATTVRLPEPGERNGTWSWVRQIKPGNDASSWEIDPIVPANPQARLEDSAPHLLDGWLKFKPKKSMR